MELAQARGKVVGICQITQASWSPSRFSQCLHSCVCVNTVRNRSVQGKEAHLQRDVPKHVQSPDLLTHGGRYKYCRHPGIFIDVVIKTKDSLALVQASFNRKSVSLVVAHRFHVPGCEG